MTVYVVVKEEFEDVRILGVYASADAAMCAHRAPKDREWRKNGTPPGAYYLAPMPYGESLEIEPHEVLS